jgi:hypothetical protein
MADKLAGSISPAMRFVANGHTFNVIEEGKSSVQSANVLGVIETDGSKEYYLDRVLDVRLDRLPDDWRLEGVVSTIAIEKNRNLVQPQKVEAR